ncbi:two-component system, NarL family, sensor histidine kinase UhpB [Geodermatophilus dictyosporus]|uniref:histidine kinase n=1 Tax=Geodermatophilus dictyosporus TaxID=1523247 RepID=A0A1I5JUI5_9ACTN|nr:HAMP domain-containing sensor histidine kinase [Geodermatophilus dictyosporus]SFO75996.1 two-component system, NarL family, sensor histidine kinase UhpB [Geodermatophilus dictyosporus]
MSRQVGLSLFWRVCLINTAVFLVGVVLLAATPATISSPVEASEVFLLAGWLALIVAANAMLLRVVLSPLDRLRQLMGDVDLLRPGQRLPEEGNGPTSALVGSFNAMLTRLEAERATSAGRALAAQEGERRRVAQELHDEVGQSLTAVLLGLRAVADRVPPDLAPEVLAVQETARASLDEVRHVVRRLRPGVLDDLGLVSALTSLAGEHARLTGARVHRRFSPSLPDLDDRVELVVYRVAQEALTNVARHAGAGCVELELTETGEGAALLLRIADDGRGMDGEPEGAGLRGMRERALLVGADLSFSTNGIRGTDVRLQIPLVPGPVTP